MMQGPVFFIGMPRSGTTVVFETFARATDFGWLSNYSEMWPKWPAANLLCPLLDNAFIDARGHKKQYSDVVLGNRYLPQPVEAYGFWDHYSKRNFSRSYLLGAKAGTTEALRLQKAVRSVLRYQLKKRLVSKLTGPGRIGYLASVFPDATIINVIRDGRAVAGSLLQVKFWQEKGGYHQPFWEGGLDDKDLESWEQADRDPAILAALQWRRVIELARLEAGGITGINYTEIRYEDFVIDPNTVLQQLVALTGSALRSPAKSMKTANMEATIANMNQKYLDSFSENKLKAMTAVMQPLLDEFGYPAH